MTENIPNVQTIRRPYRLVIKEFLLYYMDNT